MRASGRYISLQAQETNVHKTSDLALYGGRPLRQMLLPYAAQWLDDDDVAAVAEVLRSRHLTTGPKVVQFEEVFSQTVGAKYAVAVSSGTAALHAAMFALGIGPGDEVIVPALTFVATANCIVFQGGTPVFADVDSETLLIDPSDVSRKITPRTKAIIAVDYAGQPCDYDALQEIAHRHNLALVSDACHSLGGRYRDRSVGTLAEINVFSFHPVKHITTGEGGMVTTENDEWASRMRLFRSHGISGIYQEREKIGSWFYEMIELGYNYRLSDIHCALGISQLHKLAPWMDRRQEIARRYTEELVEVPVVTPLKVRSEVLHAYHLYVIQLELERLQEDRATIFKALRAEGIGANVHYIPVHLHPFYQKRFSTQCGMCPIAERIYERIISLPCFPAMENQDVDDVVTALRKVVTAFLR